MHDGGEGAGGLKFSRALLVALAAGLALRLWFVFEYPVVRGDALVYGAFAKNVMQHGVYGFWTAANGVVRPTLIRLPGYPLFLGLCFRVFGMEHYTAVMVVQTAVDLWTCVLVAAMAGRIFGTRAGMAALWMAALCPFTANYVAAPLTETMTLFCVALAFYGLLRWGEDPAGEPGAESPAVARRAFVGLKRHASTERRANRSGGMNRWVLAIGCALAYAILLRPEQGMLAAAVVPAMAWMGWKGKRRGWSEAAVLVSVLTLLPLLPWTVRNWRVFHVIQPLAPRFANDPGEVNPAGFQRWYRTWAVEYASTELVYWNYDGSDLLLGDLPGRAFDTSAQYAATESLLEDYDKTDNPDAGLDARFEAIAEERIRANPVRYFVLLPALRVLNMMFRPRLELLPAPLEWWKRTTPRGALMLALGFAGVNAAYFLLAGIGLWRRELWREHRAVAGAMVATIVMRAALLLTLDNSEPRYTLEFFPVLVVLGSGVFARRKAARRRGEGRGLAVREGS